MKVLFVGGTGIISSACSQAALDAGIELHLLCRGQSIREMPRGAEVLRGDIRDRDSARRALGSNKYDAVVDFVAFTPDHVKIDLELFGDRTDQYVFISSASAYKKPVLSLPITESTELLNPFWRYSRDKIACERLLLEAHEASGFPATIVRPSHTYDKTLLPFDAGYTALHRMKQGKPVVVHGDGTSLWVLTHHRDFALAFTGLLGNPRAIGEAFHITSDEVLTWNQIYEAVAHAAGCTPKLVYVPSRAIASVDSDWGASLLGDKSHSVIFDNTKVKRLVPGYTARIPFWQGAREIVAWYEAHPEAQKVDDAVNRTMSELIESYAV
jgi:nucleoside-diphosphate-sugar epimerase